jgi:hypothetical protein
MSGESTRTSVKAAEESLETQHKLVSGKLFAREFSRAIGL